jgi:hypothetical protein
MVPEHVDVYYVAIFEEVGVAVTPDTPVRPIDAEAVQKFRLVPKCQGFNVEALDRGHTIDV